MEIEQAKEIIKNTAQTNQSLLEGGGKPFKGALKRLVGIWNDPSHAFIELLQNADDVDATEVECQIFPNGIRFNHNGHTFTEPEIQGVCSIDNSTKDIERHTGFMGIGFKAVFKLSNSPHINCPPWQFHFSPDHFPPRDWGWILIPRWTENLPAEPRNVPNGQTVFWLPYKMQLSEESKKHIETEIYEKFDGLCLMFLRKVKKITIKNTQKNVRKLCLEGKWVIENKNGKETKSQYKIVKKLFEVPEKVKEEYAVQDSGRDQAKVREIILSFALDLKGNLQPTTKSPLYTFLPTNYFPNLRFAVQADFILDTQRAQIDESLEWNRWLWRCVKDLLTGAINGFTDTDDKIIKGFKDYEEMRYQFYRVLPTKEDFPPITEETLIQTELIKPFWEYCKNTPIVITALDAWVKPSEAIRASPRIHTLIDTQKLKQLTNRENYVHRKVQGAKEFLNEVGVQNLFEQKIVEVLQDKNWINSKDKGWFHDLYTLLWDRLYEDKKRWQDWWDQEKTVKELSIVKTTQGIAKKTSEVLFPPEKETELTTGIPNMLFVDNEFTKNIPLQFLEEIGVQTFNQESIVKTVILKSYENGTWQEWTEEQLQKCIQFIKEWLKSRETKLSPELKRRLGAIRIKTENNTLKRADRCYFPKNSLKMLYPQANFVTLEDKEQHEFLSIIGVMDKPKAHFEEKAYEHHKEPNLTTHWQEYWNWLINKNILERSTWYRKISDIRILDSWDKITWNPDVAEILLTYLVKHWETYYKQHTQSCYEYFFRSSCTQKIPSLLTWQLLETPWLPTTQGLMKPSKQIFIPSPRIKRVAGDLVPYISIPKDWKQKEFIKQGQSFFESLGISTNLDIGTLNHIHQIIQSHQVDNDMKQYLSRVYQAFGKLLEEENEIGQIELFTTTGTFEESATLYWNDDRDLGEHFYNQENLHFAWIPTDVERKNIENLFMATGVKAISEHVQRKLVASTSAQTNEKWIAILHEKAQYLHSLFSHHKADDAGMVGGKLDKISVRTSEKVEILLILDNIEKTVETPILYDIDNNILYLTPNIEEFEIAMELARTFGLDFGYVSDIEIILREQSQKIETRFQRQGIALLEWETSPLPTVEPEIEEKKESEEEPKKEDVPVAGQLTKPHEHPKTPVSTPIPKQGISRVPGPSKTVQRPGTPYEDRMKTEDTNIQRIIAFEKQNNRIARDVSKEFRGYDIESTNTTTGETRHIEVKTSGFAMLTQHEYEIAKELGKTYHLYIVDGDNLYIIKDPIDSCTSFETEIIEARWKLLNWQNNAERHQL